MSLMFWPRTAMEIGDRVTITPVFVSTQDSVMNGSLVTIYDHVCSGGFAISVSIDDGEARSFINYPRFFDMVLGPLEKVYQEKYVPDEDGKAQTRFAKDVVKKMIEVGFIIAEVDGPDVYLRFCDD